MSKEHKVITSFLKKANRHLQNLNSIKDKLDWLSKEYDIIKTDPLFNEKFHTLHKVVEQLQAKHFEDHEKNPEFTYWFLKYNAKEIFKSKVGSERFTSELNHPKSKIFLQRQLNSILKIENTADEQLLENNKQMVNLEDDKSKVLEKYRKKGYLHFFECVN
ncbi:MAG: hypothetical protein WA749_07410, partial [Gelidibacter sp.]